MWVSRSRIVIGRFAGTTDPPVATVVFANCGIRRLTGSLIVSLPSSTSDRMAVLVMAFVCEAMRKMVSVVIRRPASLSLHPTARSYTG